MPAGSVRPSAARGDRDLREIRFLIFLKLLNELGF
jgi:hypothetical protein